MKLSQWIEDREKLRTDLKPLREQMNAAEAEYNRLRQEFATASDITETHRLLSAVPLEQNYLVVIEVFEGRGEAREFVDIVSKETQCHLSGWEAILELPAELRPKVVEINGLIQAWKRNEVEWPWKILTNQEFYALTRVD